MTTKFNGNMMKDKLFSLCKDFWSPDNFWLKLLFLISGTAITALFSLSLISAYTIMLYVPSVIIGSLVWICLLFRYNFLEKIWVKTSCIISVIAGIFAAATAYLSVKYLNEILSMLLDAADPHILVFIDSLANGDFTNSLIASRVGAIATIYSYHNLIIAGVIIAIGLLALFSLYLLWKYFISIAIPLLHGFCSNLSKGEKYFLVIVSLVSIITIPVVYNLTNVFYLPVDILGNYHSMDALYGLDTGFTIEYDIYGNVAAPSNSTHQFLFGLFALPFGIIAHLVGWIFFFIPNSYYSAIAIIQVIVMGVSAILLSRLMELKSHKQVLFLCTTMLTFPYLVFSFALEQYVFCLFWIVLFIYAVLRKRKYSDWYFIGAAGSVVTSGILFPLLSNKINLRKYLSVASLFICISLVSGKLAALVTLIPNTLNSGNNFLNLANLTFLDKCVYYIDFIASCLFEPAMQCVKMTYSFVHPTTLNILGVVILVIAIIGFILNYKEKFARICFGWLAFSFVLLCIIGFGVHEMPLYSLYFGWAILPLVYLVITKTFRTLPKIQTILFVCILIAMICINIPGIYDMILFGIQYYPVR